MPGIRRQRVGKTFTYIEPDGRRVSERATLDRIRSLVIPPAWTTVWICPIPQGHLQATGRDTRQRKQHRYHPLYRAVRDQVKYTRTIAFGEALPRIRRRVRKGLNLRGLPREKVLATVVRLLETTLIRIGNEEYAKENESYGLTTLRHEHVDVKGRKLRFHFRGKSGVYHELELDDPWLARIIKRCQELPGEELFHYVGENGTLNAIRSEDVNEYLRGATGQEFTAKDFRTWNGTVLAATALGACGEFRSANQAKKNIVAAVKQVAEKLGNRPATCRKYYLHPAILECYMAGELLDSLRPAERLLQRAKPSWELNIREGLTPVEKCVMNILQKSFEQNLRELRLAV
jgi:DNA topoisomerase-1